MNGMKYHEIDHYPSSKGCLGIGKCESCDRHLTEQVTAALQAQFLRPGTAIELPYHTLIVWEDSTFTTMPKIKARLN